MADANVSQLEINGTTYDICDATARDSLSQYLPLAGGTMTGEIQLTGNPPLRTVSTNYNHIVIQHPISEKSQILDSAKTFGITFFDKNGATMGRLWCNRPADNLVKEVSMQAVNASGQVNALTTRIDDDGNFSYTVGSPYAFRQAISGYWPLYPDINRGVAPSATTYVEGMQWNDKKSPTKRLSFVRSIFQADGKNALQLTVFNSPDSTGVTEYGNSLHLYIAQDGTCSYAVSDPSAFRTAIGIANSPTTTTSVSTIFPTITTGVTISAAAVFRWNGVVQFRLTFSYNTATSSNLTVGTVASAYRPRGICYAYCTNGSYGYIDSGGTVKVVGTKAANTDYVLSFTYVSINNL